ncbi:Uma2 family endonuclease [Hymenobacter fastidiosus]|uniref:Uma2 family endonuclease n=1 Tax=Hymenobacter fastidiosus TaxID=486264 RepID=A0ABP7SYH1_9BACT
MNAPQKTTYTPEEYLAIDRSAEHKSEFWDGQIMAMSGAQQEHLEIVRNISGHFFSRLKKGCSAYTNDTRIHIPVSGSYTYPDIAVIRGNKETTADSFDTFTNPILLVEVLSPSTEANDRSAKLLRYLSIASLREYLLVNSRTLEVVLYTKDPESGRWYVTTAEQLTDVVRLPSVDCNLTLAEMYQGVELA